MSFQALNWAVKQRVGSPVSKGILMALANYADERGTCFPSHDRLVRETELSEKSVRTHLKRLEDLRIIESERMRDAAGRLGMIRYILCLDQSFDIDPEETKGQRKVKADDESIAENEQTTVEEPAASGANGPVEAGTSGSPPASEGENPPVSGSGESLSKITTLSQPLSTSPREEGREREPPSLDNPPIPRVQFLAAEPDTDPEFEALATAWPVKDKLADAWIVWENLAPTDRVAAAYYAPIFLAETSAKRKFLEQLGNWLRGKSWRFAKGVAPEDKPVPLKPFGRAWWRDLWRRIAIGERVGFVIAEAQRGNPHWVKRSIAPTEAEAERLVAVEVKSPQFTAWEAAAEAKGVRLPKPDQVPVIWCPCLDPKDWEVKS